ncbi:MAG TPA: MFS transporter [Stellaceae bacterium]|nr:MFS transporter [Stellaceae bacterium]
MEQEMSARTRWLLVIAGGIIMGAALGIRGVQGLYMIPITADRGWSREAFGMALGLQNLVWGFAQPFTGMIADRFGTAKVIFVGAILYALGLCCMAYSTTTVEFNLASGLLFGVGLSGTAFGAIYGALSRLVPNTHRSWALGVAGALGGLGQFVMVPVAQKMLNNMDWVTSLVLFAGFMVLMSPLAAYLKDSSKPHAATGGQPNQSVSAAIREALGHRGFFLLNLGFIACGFQLAFIAGHLPAYLTDKGMGAEGAIALGLINFFNIIGTYMFGHLGDLLRRKYLLSVLYAIRAAAMGLFVLLPLSHLTIYAFSIVMGMVWLGTVPLTTGLVSQVFGVRYITTLFGVVFFGHQVGSFFGFWLAGYVFDMTKSYDLIWFIAVALGVFSAIVHLPINDKQVIPARQPVAGEAAA